MPTPPSMALVPLGIAMTLLLGAAAWLDIRQRRIPNRIVAAVALLWLPLAVSGGLLAGLFAVGTAALVLGIGTAIWRMGWLGGGDVKLLAAVSLWAGPDHVGELLLATALCGGALALMSLAARHTAVTPMLTFVRGEAIRLLPSARAPASTARWTPDGALAASASRGTIPYGIAIAMGGAWLLHGLFLA